MSEKTRGTVALSVRLTDSEAAAVVEAAKRAGLTRSEYMRACLRNGAEETGGAASGTVDLAESLSALTEVLFEIKLACHDYYTLYACLGEALEEEGDEAGLKRAEGIMRMLEAVQDDTLDILEYAIDTARATKRVLRMR